MTEKHPSQGKAIVAVLFRLDPWEAEIILNLRLWNDGPLGQSQILSENRNRLPREAARREWRAFDRLVRTIHTHADRPITPRNLNSAHVGSDEAVFLRLVCLASDGRLNDAALMAALIASPAQAELIALMAGHVGTCARGFQYQQPAVLDTTEKTVVRLH